jgi:hypothetical protein
MKMTTLRVPHPAAAVLAAAAVRVPVAGNTTIFFK